MTHRNAVFFAPALAGAIAAVGAAAAPIVIDWSSVPPGRSVVGPGVVVEEHHHHHKVHGKVKHKRKWRGKGHWK